MGTIFIVGLALGWLVQQDRLARERALLSQEMSDLGFFSSGYRPSFVCRVAMLVLGGDDRQVIRRLNKYRWVNSGWLFYPTGFYCYGNPEDKVEAALAKMRRFGSVKEIPRGWDRWFVPRTFAID